MTCTLYMYVVHVVSIDHIFRVTLSIEHKTFFTAYNMYEVQVSNHVLLWWFLDCSVVLELGHVVLDALQTVGEVPVVERAALLLDPLEQARHQRLVIVLHLLQLHQTANDLTTTGARAFVMTLRKSWVDTVIQRINVPTKIILIPTCTAVHVVANTNLYLYVLAPLHVHVCGAPRCRRS